MQRSPRLRVALAAVFGLAAAVVACSSGSSSHSTSGGTGGPGTGNQPGTPPGTPVPPTQPTPPTTIDASIVRGPYLQKTTSSQTTLLWQTASPSIQMARLDGTVVAQDATATTHHQATLSGLAPLTSHTYTLQDKTTGKTLAGPVTFWTAPAPGSTAPFTILAVGDTGEGTPEQFSLAQQMTGENPAFILHTGDVVYPSGAIADYGPRFFQPYAQVIAHVPVFPTLGNHDLDDPTAPGYVDTFRLPNNNPSGSVHYYSFVWGSTKVISIDDWSDFQTTGPSPALMSWLQAELASSTSRWLVVVLHVPLFSSGAIFSQSQPVEKALAPLFEQYHVDLVLQGHDHAYERLQPIQTTNTAGNKPVTYILTGGGGGVLSQGTTTLSTTVVRQSVVHYTLLDVTEAAIHLRAVALGGSTVDDFSYTKP